MPKYRVLISETGTWANSLVAVCHVEAIDEETAALAALDDVKSKYTGKEQLTINKVEREWK